MCRILHFLRTYVAGGFLLEVCIAKWWANLGNVSISYSVTFHGISPDSKSVVLHAAEGVTRIEATSPLHLEEVRQQVLGQDCSFEKVCSINIQGDMQLYNWFLLLWVLGVPPSYLVY